MGEGFSTPISIAIERERQPLVLRFIEMGATINAHEFYAAIAKNQAQAALQMLKRCPSLAVDGEHYSCFVRAVTNKQVEVVEAMLAAGANANKLHQIMSDKDGIFAELLLKSLHSSCLYRLKTGEFLRSLSQLVPARNSETTRRQKPFSLPPAKVQKKCWRPW
jgi:hypothetical protein